MFAKKPSYRLTANFGSRSAAHAIALEARALPALMNPSGQYSMSILPESRRLASVDPYVVSNSAQCVQATSVYKVTTFGAPNVVTLYTDVACTHCAEFETTYGSTLASLRDSGKIDIEYWPLGFISAGSARASNAIACAAERDPKFAVSLYDGFFANMGYDWSNDQIMSLSTQLQATLPDGYEACVTGGTHAGWVTGIYNLAKTGAASNGTPTVYVNGTAFDLTTGTAQTLEGSLK